MPRFIKGFCCSNLLLLPLECCHHTVPVGAGLRVVLDNAVQNNAVLGLADLYESQGAAMLQMPVADDERTALHVAVMQPALNVVEFLLQRGANPAATDKLGYNAVSWAMYYAVTTGNSSLALLLLSYWPADAIPWRLAFNGAQVPAYGWGKDVQNLGGQTLGDRWQPA